MKKSEIREYIATFVSSQKLPVVISEEDIAVLFREKNGNWKRGKLDAQMEKLALELEPAKIQMSHVTTTADSVTNILFEVIDGERVPKIRLPMP
jgi:hypothetical protein